MSANDEPNGGLSRSKLLAATGEFDIQSIQFLSLANSGIEDIQALKSCSNLVRLDLRQNDLSILTPLKNLKALNALNLSANRITNIDPLGELENLLDLNLSGNLIGSFERLQCLQRLEKLEQLRLFDSVRQLSNPVCHDLSYDDKLRCMFPNLVMLDGMRLKGFGSQLTNICRDLDEQIKNERTFGPVGEYPIPSAWLRPGYFSLPVHTNNESYAITEFKETVQECKKMNESAKKHIDALDK